MMSMKGVPRERYSELVLFSRVYAVLNEELSWTWNSVYNNPSIIARNILLHK